MTIKDNIVEDCHQFGNWDESRQKCLLCKQYYPMDYDLCVKTTIISNNEPYPNSDDTIELNKAEIIRLQKENKALLKEIEILKHPPTFDSSNVKHQKRTLEL